MGLLCMIADPLSPSVRFVDDPYHERKTGSIARVSNRGLVDAVWGLGRPSTIQEWADFAARCDQQGVAGLVLEELASKQETIPEEVVAQLRHAAMLIGASNVHLLFESRRIREAFDAAGVPLLLLKGAALQLTLYRRPDLRPMSDIDLLVRPREAALAEEILRGIGCKPGRDLVREDFFPACHYEREYLTGPVSAARIDLHARPFRPLRIARFMPDEAIWEHVQTVHVDGTPALVPSAEMMFLHLAAHAAFHGGSRLVWLHDVRRLVDQYHACMDWSLVADLAQRWGLALPVLRTVHRATAVFGPICPSELSNRLETARTNWRDRLCLWHAPRDATSPVLHVLVNLATTPGIRFRKQYLSALLFPSQTHLREVYPYRHVGWPVCAHAWRALRGVIRPLTVFRMASKSG